jgi:hypothetical protein
MSWTARQGCPVEARTPSVAPKVRASSSFEGTMSTATMRRAPAMRAPWIALSPTPPAPITTTSWPGRTCAELTTAPTPVITPQASSEAASGEIASATGTIWERSTTTRSAKAPVFIAFQTSPESCR